jgi:hypothetical protein
MQFWMKDFSSRGTKVCTMAVGALRPAGFWVAAPDRLERFIRAFYVGFECRSRT